MKKYIGKYVVVRTVSAGVHVGIVEELQGDICVLTQSRRIWSWEGAFTLSEISKNGLATTSKLSETVDEIYLTGVVEVIPCTGTAQTILVVGIDPYVP
jgi:hypothetical protein